MINSVKFAAYLIAYARDWYGSNKIWYPKKAIVGLPVAHQNAINYFIHRHAQAVNYHFADEWDTAQLIEDYKEPPKYGKLKETEVRLSNLLNEDGSIKKIDKEKKKYREISPSDSSEDGLNPSF